MLSDRFGPRIVVLAGSLLLGLSCVLASRANSLLQFQLTYGVLLGVAAEFLCAGDRGHRGVVRATPQPGHLAGIGRRRRGADDDVATGGWLIATTTGASAC